METNIPCIMKYIQAGLKEGYSTLGGDETFSFLTSDRSVLRPVVLSRPWLNKVVTATQLQEHYHFSTEGGIVP